MKQVLAKSLPTNIYMDSHVILIDEKTFVSWTTKLKQASLLALNIHIQVSRKRSELMGFAFSINPGEAIYFPLSYSSISSRERPTRVEVFSHLKLILENEKISKICSSFKESNKLLKYYGIEIKGMIFDIMLESYVLESVQNSRRNLKSLVNRWLQGVEHCWKEKKVFRSNDPAIEQQRSLAVESDIILQLHLKMWPLISRESILKNIYEHIERPLLKVIFRMESHGILIDTHFLSSYSSELSHRLHQLEKKAYKIAGTSFQLSSPHQVQKVLFEQHQILRLNNLPSRRPCINAKVLLELAEKYSLPKIVIEYRQVTKLKYSYTDKLLHMINFTSGRLHTSYHQTLTTTGRLSSSQPNLQNIPVRTSEGRKIRQAFIASYGYDLITADYSQIELRILAHLSQEKNLIKSFLNHEDLHSITASNLFNIALKKVTQAQRRRGKIINFGVIYGMSAFGLSQQLNISLTDAHNYINLYFQHYPNVLTYMKKIKIQVQKTGYVNTITGRKIYIPNIFSKNIGRRNAAFRTAINAPMQGTAADIIKRAMIVVDQWIKNKNNSVRMVMQVHDELLFEVPQGAWKESCYEIRDLMENHIMIRLNVPLLVNIGRGHNWAQVH
ncbi:MAG: DNA polymerase [Candidatus Dasytiphilus stammeri]